MKTVRIAGRTYRVLTRETTREIGEEMPGIAKSMREAGVRAVLTLGRDGWPTTYEALEYRTGKLELTGVTT